MKNSLKIWEALVHSVLVKARLCSEIKNFIAYEPHMVQLCKYFTTNTTMGLVHLPTIANTTYRYVLHFIQLYLYQYTYPVDDWTTEMKIPKFQCFNNFGSFRFGSFR